MCCVVFCGVLWCLAGVLWCFAGVLRSFASVLQYFHKTHKPPEKLRKTLKTQKTHNTLVYCRRFQRAKKFDCIAQNTFHKTSAKHRKTPQNTAKQSQKTRFVNYVAKHRKTNAKRSKSHKIVVIQPQYVLRAFGVYFKNTLDLSQKYTMRNTRIKLRWVSRTPQGVTVLKKTVFCGVLQCFAVFCGVLCACF